MARVLRQDTEEFLGYLMELNDPVQSWVKDWPFRAWRHPDGNLRNYPAVPAPGQPMRTPPPLELRVPVRNGPSGELEVLIPPDLLDFFRHHTAFRAQPDATSS